MGFNMIINNSLKSSKLNSSILVFLLVLLLLLFFFVTITSVQKINLSGCYHKTAGPHRFQQSILSPYPQPPHRPSSMKRPSKWSTSPTIQTAQGRGDIASWRRPRSKGVRIQFSASSLLSGTSLILSPSQIRTDSTPWFLVLRPHGIRDGRAPSRSFGLTSSDTYRAESQETSSTISSRRN